MPYGDEVSVEMSLQSPAPAGEPWKTTDATPEPPVSAAVADRATEPRRAAPGSSRSAVGTVLLTRRSSSCESSWPPKLFTTTARRSYRPSGRAVVSRSVAYGAVVSIAIDVQEPAPAGDRSNLTMTMLAPEEPAEALADNVTVPRRSVPVSCRLTDGCVLLTVTVVVDESRELPAWSVARAIRVYWPSAGCEVQATEYGAVVSAAIGVPLAQSHPAPAQ